MLGFKKHVDLQEKIVVVGKGAKFGQIIFLAGGAASGKSFAVKNFINTDGYKILNVDEFKTQWINLQKVKNGDKDLADLRMDTKAGSVKIHNIISKKKFVGKVVTAMLKSADPKRKPNILFDETLKDPKKLRESVENLIELGYDPKNIHLIWVLTNYGIAVVANKERAAKAKRDGKVVRLVPDSVVLQTHTGAAINMSKVFLSMRTFGMDGDMEVILGNPDETISWVDKFNTKMTNSQGDPAIKTFTTIKMKFAGKAIIKEKSVRQQLLSWIQMNIPTTKITDGILGIKESKNLPKTGRKTPEDFGAYGKSREQLWKEGQITDEEYYAQLTD